MSSGGTQLYKLAAVGILPIATLYARSKVPAMRVWATLAAACQRGWEESEGYLYRFIRVEIDVNAPARRPATQHADVLAVGPVVRYLLLGYPQRFPALTAGVLLAGRNWDYGHAAADESGSSAAPFLRAHATAPSGS